MSKKREGKNGQHPFNAEFLAAFGQHVRMLREAKGYGLRELADLADLDYSNLSKIEFGTTNTTLSTAMTIAETLGITHQELFDFKLPNKRSK